MNMKNVYIIACGGTIAGRADSASNLTGYTAGAVHINELLSAVPELDKVARVHGEQLCNLDSSDGYAGRNRLLFESYSSYA